jgi:PKD repeat protein
MSRRVFCKLLLIVIVVFWACSGALFAQGRSEEALERAIAAQEKHTKVLMAKDGVEGTAVGLNENGQFVVKVYTARRGIGGIPANLEGVPVKEVVTGKIYALADTTVRFDRPVPTGVSTGHPNITAGTIACRVKDGSGNVYALSNNHVYANENRASIGDNVLQPGTYDGGINPDDAIGTLYEFEPIVFGMWGVNIIDAAIALCSTGTLDNGTPEDGYGIPSSTTLPVSEGLLGQAVQKYGRTTGLTTGNVTGINGAFLVRYSRSYAIFYDQITIEVTGFSAGGDSGSLIVTNDDSKNPVGLLFAGSDTLTIANPINAVLNRFNVTVDDGSGGSEPTNNPPTANFTYTSSNLTADFADTSTDSDGTLVAWNWAFGDGATSTERNTSHTYSSGGTYTVTLKITDNDGATDSISKDVTVSSGGIVGETMHVSAISMDYSTAGPNYFIYTQVIILDDSGRPVSEATVDVTTTFTGGSASGSGSTDSDGIVTFKLKSRQAGTYTSTVANATHASLVWDGIEKIETLQVP